MTSYTVLARLYDLRTQKGGSRNGISDCTEPDTGQDAQAAGWRWMDK